MWGRALGVLLAVAAMLPLEAQAATDAQRAQLAGRTLDVVVAFSNTGGGARFWSVFSEALRRQLPTTTIRARFNDAGSGTSAANELFALPQGALAVGFVRPTEVAFAQAQGREGVNFDLGAANWIVSVERESHFMAGRRGLPTSMDVLRQPGQRLIIPANGIDDTQTIIAFLLNAVTGLHGKVVVGFNNADRLRALVAGDADIYTLSVDKDVSALLEAGDLLSLYTIAGDDFPASVNRNQSLTTVALPDAPQPVIDYIVVARALGRAFFAPPAVAPEDVDALRAVFEDAMRDPEFVAKAEQQVVPIAIVPGTQVQADMDTLLLKDPGLKAAVDHAYKCGVDMSAGTLDTCDFGQ